MAYRRGDDSETTQVGAMLLAEGLAYLRVSGQAEIKWAQVAAAGGRKRRRR